MVGWEHKVACVVDQSRAALELRRHISVHMLFLSMHVNQKVYVAKTVQII